MRLDQAKDRSTQKYLETSSKYSMLGQFETRSRKKMAVLPDKVACNRSLRPVCIEKVVCMKTKEELDHKMCSINSKIATGCTQSEFAQRSTRSTRTRRKNILCPTQRMEEFQETWNNTVDYRIPGIPPTTVEQQDTNRKDKVKKLIEQFEGHPNKESFLQDLSQADIKTQRSSNFAKPLPKSNAPIAIHIGRSALSIVHL